MFCAAFVLLTAAAPDAPAEALQKAEKMYAAARFGEAEPLFRAALVTDDRSLKRQAYNRLMVLYVRSGRPDKAVRLAEPYRVWLKELQDADGLAALDLLTGECLFQVGHSERADEHLVAALRAGVLPTDRRLEALRLRGEIAQQRKDAAEKQRWAELETAAAEVAKASERVNDGPTRVIAGRYLADARFRRGDVAGALAVLTPLPALHRDLNDPVGLRDTQRQRATLLALQEKRAGAAELFQQAFDLHRKHQPNQRVVAGDILTEWAGVTADPAAAAALRDRAAAEYRAVLDAPADGPDAGGALAAVVRFQALTRSAKQFGLALGVAAIAAERWSGDPLVDARLKSDRGGLELMTSAYQTARTSLSRALIALDTQDPPNLRASRRCSSTWRPPNSRATRRARPTCSSRGVPTCTASTASTPTRYGPSATTCSGCRRPGGASSPRRCPTSAAGWRRVRSPVRRPTRCGSTCG